MEDRSLKRLCLYCEQCKSEVLDPLQLKNGFLLSNEEHKYSFANFETIKRYGWESVALNPVIYLELPQNENNIS